MYQTIDVLAGTRATVIETGETVFIGPRRVPNARYESHRDTYVFNYGDHGKVRVKKSDVKVVL